MPDDLPRPHAGGPPWALFLDLDGTLLEIVDHPAAVSVPEALPPLLKELRTKFGGALAVISGRALSSLTALLHGCDVDLAGCHGAEFRIDGQDFTPSTDPNLQKIIKRLAAFADARSDSFLEIKRYSAALHYRAPSLTATQAMLAVEEMIADFRDGYRAIPGKNVVEVLPRAVGKAAAVSHFLSRRNYRGRLPVFLGDDFTDEEAMARVNELGGYSIHVGHSSATCARFRVNSVSEVLTWLENTVLPS